MLPKKYSKIVIKSYYYKWMTQCLFFEVLSALTAFNACVLLLLLAGEYAVTHYSLQLFLRG